LVNQKQKVTVTSWYYAYYEPKKFLHQRELCKAVERTDCNLECRRLVSPTRLTGIPANPLTLRLRALQKALNKLEREIDHVNAEIEGATNVQFGKSKSFSTQGTFHTQDSSLETGGAPIEEISFPGNKTIRFHYDKVYFALYDFFTNLGSVLDRLAYEINLLYELGDWVEERIDWLRLINPRNRFLCCLSDKDKNLAEFIQAQATNFKKIPTYRNRLIHDSIIHTDIETAGFPRRFQVFLPRDPNKQKTQRDVDAVEFCKKTKADVLKLLDESYRLMLQHHKSHGNPPW